ncbi:hypothetical protein [Brachybacterium alimentarium]|nr:hypothetical protein [Brachybacterium alimentarium]
MTIAHGAALGGTQRLPAELDWPPWQHDAVRSSTEQHVRLLAVQ